MARRIPCEVYSRVVGYLRPVQNWNKAKVLEFEERKTYKLEKERDEVCLSMTSSEKSARSSSS